MAVHILSQLQLLLLTILLFIKTSGGTCIFDSIARNPDEILKADIEYSNRVRKFVTAEDTQQSQFHPIRIYVSMAEIDKDVSPTDVERIQLIVKQAVKKASLLFSVVPVKRTLLLKRNACSSTWTRSASRGKCSRLNSGYKGEFCASKIDFFRIPDDHLEGVNLYSENGEILSSPILPGGGIKEADYVLYVNLMHTPQCQPQDVMAYASYCQLDQNGRPIAGFINFCPHSIRGNEFNSDKVDMMAVHELFHALGFSQELLKKFAECETIAAVEPCSTWKRVVLTDETGVPRVVLPSVVRAMQDHLGCWDKDLGAPLEAKSTGGPGSHWDALLMFGSVMSPNVGELPFTSIDPITAALFNDSGWYQVNFSAVDPYFWGKDKGCTFGPREPCDQSPFFCNPKKPNSHSCDFLYSSKAQCQSIDKKYRCGVWYPSKEGSCDPLEVSDLHGSFWNRKCFNSIFQNMEHAECATYICRNTTVHVHLAGGLVECRNNQRLISMTQENITLMCPPREILCPGHPAMIPLQGDGTLLSSRTENETREMMDDLDIADFINSKGDQQMLLRVMFETPVAADLPPHHLDMTLEMTKEAAERVLVAMGLSKSWLLNAIWSKQHPTELLITLKRPTQLPLQKLQLLTSLKGLPVPFTEGVKLNVARVEAVEQPTGAKSAIFLLWLGIVVCLIVVSVAAVMGFHQYRRRRRKITFPFASSLTTERDHIEI